MEFDALFQMQIVLENKIKQINIIKKMLQEQIQANREKSKVSKLSQNLKQKIGSITNEVQLFVQSSNQLKAQLSNLKSKIYDLVVFSTDECIKKIRQIQAQKNRFKNNLEEEININNKIKIQILELKQKMKINQNIKNKQLQQKDQLIKLLKQNLKNKNQNSIIQVSTITNQTQQAVTINLQELQINKKLSIIKQQEQSSHHINKQQLSPQKNTIIQKQNNNQKSRLNKSLNLQKQQVFKRSQSKTKTRFFIDDFRKIVQKVQPSLQSINKQKIIHFNQFYHKTLSLHNISDLVALPPQKPSKLKATKIGQQPIQLRPEINQNIKYDVNVKAPIQLGRRRFSEITNQKKRSNSKQKLKVTQKQTPSRHIDQNKTPKKRSMSKQKILLTIKQNQSKSKNVLQSSNQIQLLKNKTKYCNPTVELLVDEIQKIDIYLGDIKTEQKYEGIKKQGIRIGKGKLLYINGCVYNGDFKDNMRHGYGTLLLNGKQIYRGFWQKDKICGEGTLKNFQLINKRKLSQNSILKNIYYTGQFCDNKFHGFGSFILNENQKFSSRFQNGYPVGQYCFLNKLGQITNGMSQIKKLVSFDNNIH